MYYAMSESLSINWDWKEVRFVLIGLCCSGLKKTQKEIKGQRHMQYYRMVWYDCHVAVKAGFIVEMQFWGVTRKLMLGILHGTQLPGILYLYRRL